MGGVPRYIFPAHMETVQTFGRKREAVAVAFVKKGKGLIKVNGVPIELVQPESLRFKVWEPVLLLGANRYREVDIRIRVKGGGYTSQLYLSLSLSLFLSFFLSFFLFFFHMFLSFFLSPFFLFLR